MLIFIFNLKNMWDQSWDFIIREKSPIFETLFHFMMCWPTSIDAACSGAKSGIQSRTPHRDALRTHWALNFSNLQPSKQIA